MMYIKDFQILGDPPGCSLCFVDRKPEVQVKYRDMQKSPAWLNFSSLLMHTDLGSQWTAHQPNQNFPHWNWHDLFRMCLSKYATAFVLMSTTPWSQHDRSSCLITGLVGYNDTAYSDKLLIVTLFAIPIWLVCQWITSAYSDSWLKWHFSNVPMVSL